MLVSPSFQDTIAAAAGGDKWAAEAVANAPTQAETKERGMDKRVGLGQAGSLGHVRRRLTARVTGAGSLVHVAPDSRPNRSVFHSDAPNRSISVI